MAAISSTLVLSESQPSLSLIVRAEKFVQLVASARARQKLMAKQGEGGKLRGRR
jgi:hypothetical protein